MSGDGIERGILLLWGKCPEEERMKKRIGLYLEASRLEALAYVLGESLSAVAERGIELAARSLKPAQRAAYSACLDAKAKGGAR